jgi:hypothetical protein
MLQMFHLDVAYTFMLQAYVSNVFWCFIRIFASILYGRYIYLQWFFKCFSCIFASVSDACLKCFVCLLLYVASSYFKSTSCVVHEICVKSGRWGGVDESMTRAHY